MWRKEVHKIKSTPKDKQKLLGKKMASILFSGQTNGH